MTILLDKRLDLIIVIDRNLVQLQCLRGTRTAFSRAAEPRAWIQARNDQCRVETNNLLGCSCCSLRLDATGISDSTAVSELFRYVISPGTALAVRVVHLEPSHRGLGVFLDALNLYGKVMSFAVTVSVLLYGLLIFGTMTTISALSEKNSDHS